MRVSRKWMSKIDARERFKDIEKEYPKYVNKAYNLFVECLKENDQDKLRTFLGENPDPYPDSTPGISVPRIFMYFSLRDVCRQMEKVDRENLHEIWTKSAWEWYTRKILKIPFKTIGSNEKAEDIAGIHSQELMKSLIRLPR